MDVAVLGRESCTAAGPCASWEITLRNYGAIAFSPAATETPKSKAERNVPGDAYHSGHRARTAPCHTKYSAVQHSPSSSSARFARSPARAPDAPNDFRIPQNLRLRLRSLMPRSTRLGRSPALTLLARVIDNSRSRQIHLGIQSGLWD